MSATIDAHELLAELQARWVDAFVAICALPPVTSVDDLPAQRERLAALDTIRAEEKAVRGD